MDYHRRITIKAPSGTATIDVSFVPKDCTTTEGRTRFRELLELIFTRAPDSVNARVIDCVLE